MTEELDQAEAEHAQRADQGRAVQHLARRGQPDFEEREDDHDGEPEVGRVAAEAGTSVASVHYAFRNMDELVDAVRAELLAGFRRALTDGVRTGFGLPTAVEDVLYGYWGWMTGRPGLARALIDAALSTPAATPGQDPIALGQTAVIEALRPAAPSSAPESELVDLAQLLLVAIDGLTLVHLLDPSAAAERRLTGMVRALRAEAGRVAATDPGDR